MPAPQNEQQRPPAPPKEPMSPEGLADVRRLIDGLPLQFTNEEITLLWDEAPPVTKWPDFKRFVYTAAVKSLNPLLGDLHLEYRNDRASGGVKCSIVTHLDALQKIAARTGKMDGFRQVDGTDERGAYVDSILWVKGCSHPFEFRAYYSEFVVTKSGGEATYMWSKMSRHMTAKCGSKGVLKMAFPEETSGVVTDEEMPLVTEQMRNSETPEPPPAFTVGEKPAPAPPEPPAPPPAPALAPAPPPPAIPSAPASEPPTAASPDGMNYTTAYKNMLGLLLKNNAGVTKPMVDAFYLGYFGAATMDQLPKDPKLFFQAIQTLADWIMDNGRVTFIQGSRAAGEAARPKQ